MENNNEMASFVRYIAGTKNYINKFSKIATLGALAVGTGAVVKGLDEAFNLGLPEVIEQPQGLEHLANWAATGAITMGTLSLASDFIEKIKEYIKSI